MIDTSLIVTPKGLSQESEIDDLTLLKYPLKKCTDECIIWGIHLSHFQGFDFESEVWRRGLCQTAPQKISRWDGSDSSWGSFYRLPDTKPDSFVILSTSTHDTFSKRPVKRCKRRWRRWFSTGTTFSCFTTFFVACTEKRRSRKLCSIPSTIFKSVVWKPVKAVFREMKWRHRLHRLFRLFSVDG